MKRESTQAAGFSLVEVALALGICVFCLVALQGLLLTGLNEKRESTDDVQASNIAARLLAQRRASPASAGAACLLPVLTTSVNNNDAPLFLTAFGEPTSVNFAIYRLLYDIQTDAFGVARVHLTLTAPAPAIQANAKTRYDIVTYVVL